MYKVAVMVGSLRWGSYNKQLARLAERVAPEPLALTSVSVEALPLYSEDYDEDFPAVAKEFKQLIEASDAVLIVTPEYNRSVPGVLKNAIDWGSRPDDSNSWNGKPVGIMGASTGQFGTITAQFDLRRILGHVGCLVMPQPQVLVTNVESKLTDGQFDDKTVEVVGRYMVAFEQWIRQMLDRSA